MITSPASFEKATPKLRILTFEVGFQVPTMKPGRSARTARVAVNDEFVCFSTLQLPIKND